MFVNKKHTGGDNFSRGNFFHGYIMHVSRTCFWIGLFLISLVLIAILLGMGALLGLMTQLIAVEAWPVVPWSCWASLACIALRYGNGECPTECLLMAIGLSFLLRRPILRRWGWNYGQAATGALDRDDPKAPASVALLWPFAAACKLFWFSWVRAS